MGRGRGVGGLDCNVGAVVSEFTQLKADPRLVAAQARERANEATEYVRDLRRLLGQAMRDEADAQKVARELEQEAAR